MTNTIFFVGAGISASAGIPTYRDDANGLWNMHDLQTICVKGQQYTAASFEFYNNFRHLLSNTAPSDVHRTLAKLQQGLGVERCKIYSQNIDDLLERAGCDVRKVHGSACESLCEGCGRVSYIGYGKIDEASRCEHCHGQLRNNIVYYGEKGDYEGLISDVIDLESEDTLVIIGTSNSSINLDSIIRPLKIRKIYINPVAEERYDMGQYNHVIMRKIEDCLGELMGLVQNK